MMQRSSTEGISRREAVFAGLVALLAALGLATGSGQAARRGRKRKSVTRNKSSSRAIGIGGPGGNGGDGGDVCIPGPCPD